MALRRYRDAKAEIDAGVKQDQLRSDPYWVERVVEVTVKRMKGEI